jgi:hypothetical protein
VCPPLWQQALHPRIFPFVSEPMFTGRAPWRPSGLLIVMDFTIYWVIMAAGMRSQGPSILQVLL